MLKFTPTEPEFIEMVKEKITGNHFSQFVGIKINQIAPANIEASIELNQHHRQQMGFVHGGVTATFADVVMGFAAFTLAKKGQGIVTADLHISYLNPGIGDKLHAKGYVIKTGQKLVFCEAELWVITDNQRIDIAKASSTMVIV